MDSCFRPVQWRSLDYPARGHSPIVLFFCVFDWHIWDRCILITISDISSLSMICFNIVTEKIGYMKEQAFLQYRICNVLWTCKAILYRCGRSSFQPMLFFVAGLWVDWVWNIQGSPEGNGCSKWQWNPRTKDQCRLGFCKRCPKNQVCTGIQKICGFAEHFEIAVFIYLFVFKRFLGVLCCAPKILSKFWT